MNLVKKKWKKTNGDLGEDEMGVILKKKGKKIGKKGGGLLRGFPLWGKKGRREKEKERKKKDGVHWLETKTDGISPSFSFFFLFFLAPKMKLK